MATQPRPYQGYPYTNPHVTDAPSIDSETASRWAHLPRKPLEIRNVVYVDMPTEGSEVICNESASTRPGRRKSDIDENPVIYIDVPESSSSSMAEPAEPHTEPEFVQDTIFYDPFDNRRIDQEKDAESDRSSDSESAGSGANRSHTPPVRSPPPVRSRPPASLNVHSPGSSSGFSSNYSPNSGLPHSLSKEAYVYGRQPTPDDGFPLSPIPVSEFPQPPPAYSETETPIRAPLTDLEAAAITEPPRTLVITGTDRTGRDESSPIGLPNPCRKVVFCHHCGQRVHTLVIRQTGTTTHVIALTLLFFMLIPLTVLVYCIDAFKDKVHYCPNCNKMIGYESPIFCQDMRLTS